MDLKPPIFISHSSHEDAAAQVRLTVAAQLEAAGFDVLVDDRLVPGAAWDPEVRGWLGRAWGAVVLFSPAALESEQVRSEVEILMQYRWRLGAGEFPVVPVLLGGVAPETLRNDARWAPSRVTALDLFRWEDDPLELVVKRLRPVLYSFSAAPHRELDLHLEQALMPLADGLVRSAAARLGLSPADWEAEGDPRPAFARSLLDAEFEDQVAAVRVLANGDPKVAGNLYRQAAPWSWVSGPAADHFRSHCHPLEPLQCLGLSSTSTTTCERHVRRADWRWTSRDAETAYSESVVEDILRTAHDALCYELNLPTETPDEEVAARLDTAKRNVVIRLTADAAEADVVAALRARYPRLSIVVLGAPKELPGHPGTIIPVEPALESSREATLLREDDELEAHMRQMQRVE